MKSKSSEWEDATNYRRGEAVGQVEPRTYKRHIGNSLTSGLCITITRHIHYPPDVWLMQAIGIANNRELSAKNIEAAKLEAETIVEEWCLAVLEELKQ